MYGCEEPPADQPILVDVVLEGADGTRRVLPYPDEALRRFWQTGWSGPRPLVQGPAAAVLGRVEPLGDTPTPQALARRAVEYFRP